MKKRMGHVFNAILFTLLLVMLAGCTEKKEAKAPDKNIQTIEAVLQNTFTGPSDELKQIMDKKSDEKLEAQHQYDEKMFKDYFANETSYTEYVNNYGSTIMIEPIKNDYKIHIENIKYEKVDGKDNIYDFTVKVQLQKEGSDSSKVETVNGQANLNDKYKLEIMVIHMEDLYKAMSN